jgi:hypothetical protein
MKDDIGSAYLFMLEQSGIVEEKKFSYDGSTFVNRPPTPEETAKNDALREKWKNTMALSPSAYVQTVNTTHSAKQGLENQNSIADKKEVDDSKKRAKEFTKTHSFK